MTSVTQLLQRYQALEPSSDSAKRDVELLLCHVLKKSSAYLRAWPEADVDEDNVNEFQTLLIRRQQGEPIAYLIGEQGFWTLDLKVSPATLIPRPETELLVEFILETYPAEKTLNILDLGSGTGAIALALASERPQWQITGSDIESAAVDLANSNRQHLLPATTNVSFVQSNWFDSIGQQNFDLIVSNPPYIDIEDPHLKEGDVRFEPLSALVADNKGLADFSAIISRAPEFLAPSGSLIFEHGYDQGPSVASLLRSGGFVNVFTHKDLAEHDRMSGGVLSATASGMTSGK